MTITANLMRESGVATSDSTATASATEKYLFQQDTGANISGYQEILQTGLLPKFGTRYAGTSAICTSYNAEPDPRNRSVWYVTVNYETRNASFEKDTDDPIKQPAKVWYGLRKYNEVVEFAYTKNDNGVITDDRDTPTKAIEDTAGSPFNPGVVEEKHYLTVFVEKNYRDFNPGDIADYVNTVNKDEVTIGGVKFNAEEAWMASIKHTLMFDSDGDAYDRMHFEVVRNEKRWDRKIPSTGFYQLITANDKAGGKKPITNADIGHTKNREDQVTVAQRLDAGGQYTDIPWDSVAVDGQFLHNFLTKWKTSWQTLDLPIRKDGRK